MRFGRVLEAATFLVAGAGLYGITLGGELGAASVAVIAAAFVASLLVPLRRRRRPAWGRALNAALVVVLLLQVVRGVVGEATLALGLQFAAALQLARLAARHRARDYQQIAVIAFLHLTAATVLSTELVYAIVFVLFAVAVPWLLSLAHLLRLVEEGAPGPDPVARARASRDLVGGRYLAGTAALLVPVFTVTLLLFAAFPRIGAGFLTRDRHRGQPTSGFASTISLGGFGAIRDDLTVVVRITPPATPAPPPPQRRFRLRGATFDRYDGVRWTRTRGGAVPLPQGGSTYRLWRWPDRARDQAYAITVEPLDEPVVFLPEGTVGLELPGPVRFGVERRRPLYRLRGGDVRHDGAPGLGLAYTAFVSDDPPPPARLPAADRERYLALPPDTEAVARLARAWTAGAGDDEARATRLLHRLRDSGELRYSLKLPETGGAPPLDVFLFSAKAGHCEYFSTALAVMLRSLGIPARNVTGYVGGRYNPYGGYYALRQADAHSWVEAYLPERGWVTLDPTPAARDLAGARPGFLGGLAALVDALQQRWQRHVVGYDLRAQTGLFRRLRRWARGGGGRVPTAAPARARGGRHLPPAALLAVAAATLLVGGGVLWRRRRRRDLAVPPHARAARDLYLRLEAALARRGVPRPATRTPGEHVAWLHAVAWPGAATAAAVTALYEAARFGGRPPGTADLARLRRAVVALRRGDRAGPPGDRLRAGTSSARSS